MVTFGSPHEGVSKVPFCFEGFICGVVNFFARQLVYFDIVQKNFGPAGYFRDENRIYNFRKYSHFLADLNSESKNTNELDADIH